MNRPFIHCLKIVTAVHVGVVLLFVLVSSGRAFLRRTQEVTIPVEFVIEVPAEPAVVKQILPEVKEKEPDPEPLPMPKPKPKPKAKITRSTKKIVRSIDRSPPRKRRLSDKDIKRLLTEGLKTRDRTSISDEDTRCDLIVHNELYAAWKPLSIEEVGNDPAKVSIRFAKDGRIISRKLLVGSGHAHMDASIMRAVNAVQRIRGLSEGYLKRNEWVTIVFKVK